VTEGFTLEIPDTGDRFLSIQITDENHITPLHLYGGGVGKFTADQFETDFVGSASGSAPTARRRTSRQSSKPSSSGQGLPGAKEVDSLPQPDLNAMLKVREPMIVQYSKLPNTFGVMQAHTQDVGGLGGLHLRHRGGIRSVDG
jgi:hypothetical protein